MIGRIFGLTLAILLMLSSVLTAATITASVDKTEVGLGDPITLKITLVGKGGNLPEPKLPDLSGFDVYSSGRSQNISIVSGAFSSTLDLSYILVPKKVGEMIIGPVVVLGMTAVETDLAAPGEDTDVFWVFVKSELTEIGNSCDDFFPLLEELEEFS